MGWSLTKGTALNDCLVKTLLGLNLTREYCFECVLGQDTLSTMLIVLAQP